MECSSLEEKMGATELMLMLPKIWKGTIPSGTRVSKKDNDYFINRFVLRLRHPFLAYQRGMEQARSHPQWALCS